MLGPTIIFDKSFLQSLNIDESVWLDKFFYSNITPLFYVETLADLEKQVKAGQTPEEVVGALAYKTPSMNCIPNIHHHMLAEGNLRGYPVPMDYRPVTYSGKMMQSVFGIGLHYQSFPEMEAFQRWQEGDYLKIERSLASQWRRELSNYVFESKLALIKDIAPRKLKSFAEVKLSVDNLMKSEQLNVSRFAPYATHVLKVDLFFYLSRAAGLVSHLPNNRSDMAYLCYLPFTKIFVSSDKLHEKTVPLFIDGNQAFIRGQELKKALAELDAYYSKLPDEVKSRGVIKFAPHPPKEYETLVSDLWDRFIPGWRQNSQTSLNSDDEVTVEYLTQALDGAVNVENSDQLHGNPDYMYEQAYVPRKKGKWDILPQDTD